MVVAGWHLLIAAWSHTLDMFGSPVLFGLAGVALLFAFVFMSGLQRERASVFARVGWSLCLVLLSWAVLVQYSAVTTIYQDHVAFVTLEHQRFGRIHALHAQATALQAELLLMDAALNKIKIANRVDGLAASRTTGAGPSPNTAGADDPDALYQSGQHVADINGARIDRTHGIVSFDRLTTRSYINFESVTDFGALELKSCSSQTKWSELAANNVTVTSYLGVVCKIVKQVR